MKLYPNKQEPIQIEHPTKKGLKIRVVPTKHSFRVENVASDLRYVDDYEALLKEEARLERWSRSLCDQALELNQRAGIIRQYKNKAKELYEREVNVEREERLNQNVAEAHFQQAKELKAREERINLMVEVKRSKECQNQDGINPIHFTRRDHPLDQFVFKMEDNTFYFLRKYLDHMIRYNP